MIYIHKILPLLISPISIVILVYLISIIFNLKKTAFVNTIILIVISTPIFSNHLLYLLEKNYNLKPASQIENADAVVVLSGMLRTVLGQHQIHYEWNEASDRIFAGINLIKNKKSPLLVLTGGKLPWSRGDKEGIFLKKIAEENGVKSENIVITDYAENTEQEATETKKLFIDKNPKIILVTSAFHMPRAKTIFEAKGLHVVPFAVDFRRNNDDLTIMSFLPSAEALHHTSFSVREFIGRIYYSLKY
jgi:uncharacterized SAM-binding protein YcdF (DUF218 family)